MTRLWLIFFSCCLAVAGCANSVPAGCPTVFGKLEFSPAPDGPQKKKPIRSDIVIWLSPLYAAGVPALTPEHVLLLQKDKMFHPHTLAISVGSVVDFPNADPIFHNAFSNYDGELFDVGLYPPGTTRSVRFTKPGIVRVFCNIHPSMSAVIVVLDTPYFTMASADGRYRIPNVPPGPYELHVFDERATTGSDSRLAVSVSGEAQQVTAPPIHISEAKYLNIAHKNKYGMDYPSSSASMDTYTGVSR